MKPLAWRVSWWGFALLVLGILGCACTATFVVQQYRGAPLPAERIAVLRVDNQTSVGIIRLDEERIDFAVQDTSTRFHIEMLPGKHAIDVVNLNDPLARYGAARFETLRFVAQAGRVYRVVIEPRPGGAWTAKVWEVDRDDDRLLSAAPTPRPKWNVHPEEVPPVPSSAPDGGAPPRDADATPICADADCPGAKNGDKKNGDKAETNLEISSGGAGAGDSTAGASGAGAEPN